VRKGRAKEVDGPRDRGMAVFGPLKRPCQKSLPSSLFQREESSWEFDGEFPPLFPLWKREAVKKFNRG
jgi:hypothetical protein